MQSESLVIPGYRLVRKLGQGAFGVVLEAESLDAPSSRVAIKVMKQGVSVRAKDVLRFRREGRVGRELQHPNILPILDLGQSAGREYIVMEFVEGETLQQRIARRFSGQNRQDAARTSETLEADLRHFAAICRTVDFAHRHGVIHRDIKPGNILVRSDSHPFLIDFGLARRLRDESTLTSSGVVVGTCFYMAPEQLTGETQNLGPATDIYSLGATLHAICTGRVPFTAQTYEELRRIVVEHEVPRAPRGLAPGLETIWLRALEKQPKHRYPSAAAMAEDVERSLTGLSSKREGMPILALRTFRSLRRRRWAMAVGVVTLLLLLVTILWSRAQDADAVHAQATLAEGNAHLMSGDFELARTAFLRLTRLQPSDPEPHLHLAGVEFLMGRRTSALTHVQTARELGFQPVSNPTGDPVTDYSTGLFLLANGNEFEALERLRVSVEHENGIEHARLKLALLLWRNGYKDEALHQLDSYIDHVAPRNPASLHARVLRRELVMDIDGALAELDEGLRRHGMLHLVNASGTRGRLLLRKNCFVEARAELLEATRNVPDEPSNWICLALCHLDQGDWTAAFDAGSIGLGLDPGSLTAHALLARIELSRKRYDHAAMHLRNSGAGLDDTELEAWVGAERSFDRASELIWTEGHAEGVAILEEGLAAAPNHLGCLMELGQVHWIEGRNDEALSLLVRARDVLRRVRVPVPIGRDMLHLPFIDADNTLHLHTMIFANAVLAGRRDLAGESRTSIERELGTRSRIAANRAFNYAEALWNSRLPEHRDVVRARNLLDSQLLDWSEPLSDASMRVVQDIRRSSVH